MIKQKVVLAYLLVVVTLLVTQACLGGQGPSTATPSEPTVTQLTTITEPRSETGPYRRIPPTFPPIRTTVSADKASYLQDEPITLTVSLKNVSPEPLEIGFPPSVEVQRIGDTGPAQVLVPEGTHQRVLAPSEEVDLPVSLPKNGPSPDLPPGSYVTFIEVEILSDDGRQRIGSNHPSVLAIRSK
jgi:hypothetical protein